MPAEPWILVLIQSGAVKALQRPRVGGEVAGNPVHDHADASLVQRVDEVAEFVGRSEPGDGREIAGDVVAPRAFVRVLGDGEELDMGISLPAHVIHEIVGECG